MLLWGGKECLSLETAQEVKALKPVRETGWLPAEMGSEPIGRGSCFPSRNPDSTVKPRNKMETLIGFREIGLIGLKDFFIVFVGLKFSLFK